MSHFKERIIIGESTELIVRLEREKDGDFAILTIKENDTLMYSKVQEVDEGEIIADIELDVYFGNNRF